MKKLIGLLFVGIMLIGLSGTVFAHSNYSVKVKGILGGKTLQGIVSFKLQRYSSGSWRTVDHKYDWAVGITQFRRTLSHYTTKTRANNGDYRVIAEYWEPNTGFTSTKYRSVMVSTSPLTYTIDFAAGISVMQAKMLASIDRKLSR